MLIIEPQVLSIATSIVNTLQVHYGVGRHLVYLIQDPARLEKALMYVQFSQPFSTFSSCFAKISVALLLMRLMARNRTRELFLWFIIGLLLVVNTVFNIVTFTQCRPVRYLWSVVRDGHCINGDVNTDLGYLQGGTSLDASTSI